MVYNIKKSGGINMKILAHRGIHLNALENSLESFEIAAQADVSGVELDIRLTADNEVVVFHDEDLKRLFENDSKIASLTLDELNEITESEGVTVPRLSKVFDLMLKEKIINVEIKEMKVVQPLIEMLKNDHISLDNLIFSSFIHESLLEIRRAFNEAKIGLLIGEDAQKSDNPLEYLMKRVMEYKPYSLHLPVQAFAIFPKDMLLDQLNQLKVKSGLKYAWWTVNNEEEAALLLKNGTISDYIITDNTELINRMNFERE